MKKIFCFFMLLLSSMVSISYADSQNLITGPAVLVQNSLEHNSTEQVLIRPPKPAFVRGIHLTSWVAGSKKARENIDLLLNETEINTVVIDIKEYKGEVYIPGVKLAEENKTFVPAIPDIKEYLEELKKRNIFTIARIVVFKDDIFSNNKPEWAVKSSSGGIWKDRSGNSWLDPYNKNNWRYIISIAKRAAELGFQEIQFDYIRFPSDGNIKLCRYSKKHDSVSSSEALSGFLKEASSQLKPLGVYVSIDIFGLVTTNMHDMGIGQKLIELSETVDYICPMVYPSHYNPGEYTLADPDLAPYETVYFSLNGAKKRMGESFTKIRPYLQDFSLKHHYGVKEVREQIQAAYDNDMGEWLLWNPRCKYTRGALKSKEFATVIEKSGRPEPKMRFNTKKTVQPGTGINISSSTAVSVSTAAASEFSVIQSSQSELIPPALQTIPDNKTENLTTNTTPQIRQ